MPATTLQAIASYVGGTLIGDGSRLVYKAAGLAEATEGDLTFLANPRYEPLLQTTRATAAIVSRRITAAPCALIQTDNPDLAFGLAVSLLVGPTPCPSAGIHPTAVISSEAHLAEGVSIGAGTVIEAGASIGARTILYPHVYVGHETVIGEDCILYPGVVLYHRVSLGSRVILHANVVVGSDGFGYSWDGKRHAKIPQLGTVRIGDDVEIGAGTTIDRARFGETVIGPGTKIDNLVQIAHNVTIGAHTIIVAQVGISGSTKIGNGVVIGGQTGIAGHIEIGDGAKLAAKTGVLKNIPPGEEVGGCPALPREEWLNQLRHMKTLPRLRSEVKDLLERVKRLEDEAKNA